MFSFPYHFTNLQNLVMKQYKRRYFATSFPRVHGVEPSNLYILFQEDMPYSPSSLFNIHHDSMYPGWQRVRIEENKVFWRGSCHQSVEWMWRGWDDQLWLKLSTYISRGSNPKPFYSPVDWIGNYMKNSRISK